MYIFFIFDANKHLLINTLLLFIISIQIYVGVITSNLHEVKNDVIATSYLLMPIEWEIEQLILAVT